MQLLGDYDLQFGVLALRLFFVSGDQLVSAINEWEAQDELSLSELLIRSGRISADESQMIEGLLPGRPTSPQPTATAFSPPRAESEPVHPDVDVATANAISGTIRLDEIAADSSSLDVPLPQAVRDQLAAKPPSGPTESATPSVPTTDVSVDDSVTGTLRTEQFLPPAAAIKRTIPPQKPKTQAPVKAPSKPKSAMSRLFGWLRKDN